jgi:hypothetical protein
MNTNATSDSDQAVAFVITNLVPFWTNSLLRYLDVGSEYFLGVSAILSGTLRWVVPRITSHLNELHQDSYFSSTWSWFLFWMNSGIQHPYLLGISILSILTVLGLTRLVHAIYLCRRQYGNTSDRILFFWSLFLGRHPTYRYTCKWTLQESDVSIIHDEKIEQMVDYLIRQGGMQSDAVHKQVKEYTLDERKNVILTDSPCKAPHSLRNMFFRPIAGHPDLVLTVHRITVTPEHYVESKSLDSRVMDSLRQQLIPTTTATEFIFCWNEERSMSKFEGAILFSKEASNGLMWKYRGTMEATSSPVPKEVWALDHVIAEKVTHGLHLLRSNQQNMITRGTFCILVNGKGEITRVLLRNYVSKEDWEEGEVNVFIYTKKTQIPKEDDVYYWRYGIAFEAEVTLTSFVYNSDIQQFVNGLVEKYEAYQRIKFHGTLYIFKLLYFDEKGQPIFDHSILSTSKDYESRKHVFDHMPLREIWEPICRNIDRYCTNNGEYFWKKLQIPRVGICLAGEPGTGKSHMLKRLCLRGNMNMMIINPKLIVTENQYFSLLKLKEINGIPISLEQTAIVMEELDDAKWSWTRNNEYKSVESIPIASLGPLPSDKTNGKKEGDEKEVVVMSANEMTLGTMLMEWDGPASKKTWYLSTTNHPEKLDSAITRPGRLELFTTRPLTEEECILFAMHYIEGTTEMQSREWYASFCQEGKKSNISIWTMYLDQLNK